MKLTTFTLDLPDAGMTRFTLEQMKKAALSGAANPAIPKLVFVKGTSNEEKGAQLAQWIFTHVCYVPDPPEYEYVQYPHVTLRVGGDCDDLTTLFAAMAKIAGIKKVSFVAIKYKGNQNYAHVFPAVNGIACDPCLDINDPPTFLKGDKFITIGVLK